MKDHKSFIDASVAFQCSPQDGVEMRVTSSSLDYAQRALSGMAIVWDHKTQQPTAHNGWHLNGNEIGKNGHAVNMTKTLGALNGILSFSPDFTFIVDMADHRARSIVDANNHSAPVFCFNRRKSNNSGKILWPLPGYQDLGTDDFLGPPNLRKIAFEDKMSKVIWRGSAGGWARLGKFGRGKMKRFFPLLRAYENQKLTLEETKAALSTTWRHRFVENNLHNPQFDVGYTNITDRPGHTYSLLEPYEKEKVSQKNQTKFKYIAVLPGADVGSNFYWVMNSSSLGLVMEADFDSFASDHFKPWKHYVPVKPDLSDLSKNLAWCDDNPDKVKSMIRNANEVCDMLSDASMRQSILNGVIRATEERLVKNSV